MGAGQWLLLLCGDGRTLTKCQFAIGLVIDIGDVAKPITFSFSYKLCIFIV